MRTLSRRPARNSSFYVTVRRFLHHILPFTRRCRLPVAEVQWCCHRTGRPDSVGTQAAAHVLSISRPLVRRLGVAEETQPTHTGRERSMRFMTIVKNAESVGQPPTTLFAAMDELRREATAKGAMVSTGGSLATPGGAVA